MSEIRYFLNGKIAVIETESELPFGGEFIAYIVGQEDFSTEACDTIQSAIGQLVIDYPEKFNL